MLDHYGNRGDVHDGGRPARRCVMLPSDAEKLRRLGNTGPMDQTRTRHQPDILPVPVEAVRVGQTFGRLRVLDPNRRLHGKRCALCRCSCGTEKIIRTEHLRSGQIKSCGCLHAEQLHLAARKRREGIW